VAIRWQLLQPIPADAVHCGCQEGIRPPFDRRLARWLTGKRVLIGMRHLDEHDQTVHMTQLHGEILRFQADQLLIRDLSSGEELDIPPDTRVFRYAPTGEYRLRSTGEVVSDPDAECRWSVRPGSDRGQPVSLL